VEAFLAAHRAEHGHVPTAGVMPLLEYLRSEGVVAPESPGRCTSLDRLLAEYREWLLVERALAPDTVRGYVRLAGRFLAGRVSPGDQVLVRRSLAGADVTGFLLGEAARVRPGSVACHANQLRSLLRFLTMRGLADPGSAADRAAA
jgi:integrase/recombinase XerD